MTHDPTACRQCVSLKADVIAAKKELSDLRRFKAEVQQAFGMDSTEQLHLASELVGLAKQAVVLWGLSPMSTATHDVMGELTKAAEAAYESTKRTKVHPERPEDKAVEDYLKKKCEPHPDPEMDPELDPRGLDP